MATGAIPPSQGRSQTVNPAPIRITAAAATTSGSARDFWRAGAA